MKDILNVQLWPFHVFRTIDSRYDKKVGWRVTLGHLTLQYLRPEGPPK